MWYSLVLLDLIALQSVAWSIGVFQCCVPVMAHGWARSCWTLLIVWSSWTINGAGSCLVKLDLKRSTPLGEGWPRGARGAFFPPSVPFPPPGFGRTCALVVGLEMATTSVHHPSSGQAWIWGNQGYEKLFDRFDVLLNLLFCVY